MKMAVIGMGKQHGAEQVHESGFHNMGKLMPQVARVIFDNTKILFGLGLIENAFDKTCKVRALLPDEIWEQEPELLKEAKGRMGRLLLDNLDVLVVDRIGKDISGDGMDPNVTGRFAGWASGPAMRSTGNIPGSCGYRTPCIWRKLKSRRPCWQRLRRPLILRSWEARIPGLLTKTETCGDLPKRN